MSGILGPTGAPVKIDADSHEFDPGVTIEFFANPRQVEAVVPEEQVPAWARQWSQAIRDWTQRYSFYAHTCLRALKRRDQTIRRLEQRIEALEKQVADHDISLQNLDQHAADATDAFEASREARSFEDWRDSDAVRELLPSDE